jgi:hypothetical protein
MYIAARLAHCATASAPGVGFHGNDIVVRELSPLGFLAESTVSHAVGELVRLKLPGAGAMLARVSEAAEGRLSASFLNPVGEKRLGMALGMSRVLEAA